MNELEVYRDNMEFPMEFLNTILEDIGMNENIELWDYQIVEAAAQRLKTLYEMLLATGMKEEDIKAKMY